jgi:exopolysaccharide production protein ExoQ
MSSNIATVICALFILALFLLERGHNSKVSSALWIPVLWLSLAASRSVSQWVGGVGSGDVDQYIEGTPLDALIFAGLMAAGLAVLLTRRQQATTFLRANWLLLVFFIYCGFSILWSDYSFVAFKRWIKAVGDLIMILVVLTDPDPSAAVRRFLARPGFVLIPLSLLFIRYYPYLGRSYSIWTGTATNIGVSTQKNGLGIICLIFGLGSFLYLFEVLRVGRQPRAMGPLLARGAILVLVLWLFTMADSATSFGCFLIGGVLIVATSLRMVARTPAILHLIVGLLLFGVFYGIILNPEAGFIEVAGRDPTLTGRTVMWGQLLKMTVDPWFGAGYESFWLGPRTKEISDYYQHINQAHNGYLEIYLNLGWVGVALLGAVMVWGYRNINRVLHWDSEAGRVKLAFLGVVTIYNLTEHAFRELHPVWIVFLLAVIAIPKDPESENRGQPKEAGIRNQSIKSASGAPLNQQNMLIISAEKV